VAEAGDEDIGTVAAGYDIKSLESTHYSAPTCVYHRKHIVDLDAITL
jgi:hypothetical protein